MTTKFEVQTKTVADGWVNTWHENDEPMLFDTFGEALEELDDHLDECLKAFGNAENRDNYRIVQIG